MEWDFRDIYFITTDFYFLVVSLLFVSCFFEIVTICQLSTKVLFQCCFLFFVGCLPAGLPTSCLTLAPRLDQLKPAELPRKPLAQLNGNWLFIDLVA